MELVTLYKANRLDSPIKERPSDLAEDFVATLSGADHQAYTPSGRIDVEFEYRWWLTDPNGKNSTWGKSEWPAMWQALVNLLNEDPEAKEIVLRVISEPIS